MSEMVERVAEKLRAECLAVFGSTWNNDVSARFARAAIEAMREPTPELLEAMSEGFSKEPSRDDPMPDYLQRQRNALNAFITTALK